MTGPQLKNLIIQIEIINPTHINCVCMRSPTKQIEKKREEWVEFDCLCRLNQLYI